MRRMSAVNATTRVQLVVAWLQIVGAGRPSFRRRTNVDAAAEKQNDLLLRTPEEGDVYEVVGHRINDVKDRPDNIDAVRVQLCHRRRRRTAPGGGHERRW